MSLKSRFVQRCFDLARLGIGRVSPNPAVGAVLVHDGRIIGEGYHPYYGGPHAEVMAVDSVRPADRALLPQSTLYVSLEPCNFHGKTPACTQLILREKIPHVVVAQRDFTPGVDGAGLELLRRSGVRVEEGILKDEGFRLSLPRNVLVSEERPYVLLKYAQTRDGYLAPLTKRQFWITNRFSKLLVHKWRTETDAILIGAQTARSDNPALTSRLYPGKSPVRLLISRNNDLPAGSKLLDREQPSWIFCQTAPAHSPKNVRYIAIDFKADNWLQQILSFLKQENIGHLTVEGGAWLLQQFIAAGYWDEARVFTGNISLSEGLEAPTLSTPVFQRLNLGDDQLELSYNPATWNRLYNR